MALTFNMFEAHGNEDVHGKDDRNQKPNGPTGASRCGFLTLFAKTDGWWIISVEHAAPGASVLRGRLFLRSLVLAQRKKDFASNCVGQSIGVVLVLHEMDLGDVRDQEKAMRAVTLAAIARYNGVTSVPPGSDALSAFGGRREASAVTILPFLATTQ